MIALKRKLVAFLILLLTAALGGSPAQAEEPIDITGQITDRADALGPDEAEVRKALDRFFDRTGLQLFVVYVPTFDDLTGPEWAARTAERSALGKADVLLVVATKDRAYGYRADDETFTADDLETVDRQRILPALRNDDFAGAAIQAADGLGDIAEDDGLPWGGIVLVAIIVLLAGAFVTHRVRRRFERTHHVLDEHGNPVDPAAILTLEELDEVASRALVAVDDALMTSADELRHAEAEFERRLTDGFRFTVDRGRASMRQAFSLRQQLDASPSLSDRERRRMASRLLAICEEVDHSLDDQVESFDTLRDLSSRVPQVLDQVSARVDELAAREPDDHAGRLVAAAQEQVERARTALADDETKYAILHTRAAEEAIAQAATLVDDTTLDAQTAARADASVVAGLTSVGKFITTRRAAVRAPARALLSEGERLLKLGETVAAERLIGAARASAESDVEAWRSRQETRGEDRRSPTVETLVLGGILVKPIGRNGLGGIGSLLGGSSHGGGSGEPYGGSERPGSSRTPGSFGGTRTRGRLGGGGRF